MVNSLLALTLQRHREQLEAVVDQAVAELFDKKVSDEWLPLRLIGVGATNLMREGPVQGHLFEEPWRRKQRALDQTVDHFARFQEESSRLLSVGSTIPPLRGTREGEVPAQRAEGS